MGSNLTHRHLRKKRGTPVGGAFLPSVRDMGHGDNSAIQRTAVATSKKSSDWESVSEHMYTMLESVRTHNLVGQDDAG